MQHQTQGYTMSLITVVDIPEKLNNLEKIHTYYIPRIGWCWSVYTVMGGEIQYGPFETLSLALKDQLQFVLSKTNVK